MTDQAALIESFGGTPTPEQAAQLLYGDTTAVEIEEAPEPQVDGVADDDVEPVDPVETVEPVESADSVIVAKDGIHTIPYEKLTEARNNANTWKAEAESARAELERLRAEGQSKAVEKQMAVAEAAIDAGVDPELFGDFSEEDLKKGILKLVDAEVSRKVEKLLEPIKAQKMQSEADAHYREIYSAHPDADSIFESGEFQNWMASKPGFMQKALTNALTAGAAKDIIEVFGQYKAETAKPETTKPVSTANQDKAKAKEIVSKAKPSTPMSLSDIPGGRVADNAGRLEAIRRMTPQAQIDAVMALSPEQREAYMNNQV
jgi:hypothetical protein